MAIYCKECEKKGIVYEIKPGAKFCGRCGTIVSSTTPVPTPTPPPTPPPTPVTEWRNDNRMPQGIALGVDEQIVKKYTIGRYTLRQGSVDVIVTNKRVIRYEDSNWLGMQSNCIEEINIDAVHGVSCAMARSASILGLVSASAIGIVGLIWLLSDGNLFGALLVGIAALILVNSFRPSMLFCIQGALGSPSLETSVNMLGRLFGKNNSSIIFQFKPTAETTVMLKEIGACIYDLKTLGDKAITKWRK